jgi:arylsulfatase A-like enzyme
MSIVNRQQNEELVESPPATSARVLVMASWFGLVTGMIEGVMLFAVFGLGFLNSNIRAGVSVEIIWISAVVNLLLFLGLGLLIGGICASFFRRRLSWIFTLFAFITFLDWTALTGRLGPVAVLALSAGVTLTVTRWFRTRENAAPAFFRRTLPWVAAVVLLSLVVIEGTLWTREQLAERRLVKPPQGAPNVLIVVVDTLRADHASLYGYKRLTMPNLDAIAKQGALFENDIAASSWTLPSHASLLTGRYPHEHLAEDENPLDRRYPTLPEVLQGHGYRTGGFSANTYYFSRRGGFTRGFIHFEDYFYSVGDMFFRTVWGRILNRYAPDSPRFDELPTRKRAAEVNRELLHWIDANRNRPFFAFINYFDLHEPYSSVPGFENKFHQDLAEAPQSTLTRADQQVLREDNPYLYRLARMSPRDFQQQMDNYDDAIAYADDQIGKLFSELEKRGLTRNTLVVITSDHGEAFRDHGLLTHRNALYRELIHVPLVYWWPGKISAWTRISRPVTAVSLPATVMDLIGARPDGVFPVPSLARLWQHPNDDPGWQDPLSELAQNLYIPHSYPASKGWMKAVVGPRWQLVVSATMPPELYQWTTDPKELENLAGRPETAETVGILSTELWKQVVSKPSGTEKPEQAVSKAEPYRAPVTK